MSSRLADYVEQFFPGNLSRPLRELYLAFGIGDLAVSAVMLFEPVYLYRLGYSIAQILLYYLAIYVIYFFLLPLGGAAGLRWGYKRMITVSSFLSALYYFMLLGVAVSPAFLPCAVIAYALQKMFYWPGYHYDFASHGQDMESGREVSAVEVIDLIIGALAPFLGALVLLFSSFSVLFVLSAVLIVVSVLPLTIDPEPVTPQPFPYMDAMRRLANPEKRRVVFSIMGYGEELIGLVLWPIFIYIIVKSNLFSLGSLVALTTFATTIIVLYIGRLTDRTNKRAVLRLSAMFYAIVWSIRVFIQSVGGVFVVDTMSRIMKRMLTVPQMSMIYDRARLRQHAMATSILYEMSLVMGKIFALCITWLLFMFVPIVAWTVTFVVAAMFSLLYLIL